MPTVTITALATVERVIRLPDVPGQTTEQLLRQHLDGPNGDGSGEDLLNQTGEWRVLSVDAQTIGLPGPSVASPVSPAVVEQTFDALLKQMGGNR